MESLKIQENNEKIKNLTLSNENSIFKDSNDRTETYEYYSKINNSFLGTIKFIKDEFGRIIFIEKLEPKTHHLNIYLYSYDQFNNFKLINSRGYGENNNEFVNYNSSFYY
jgi:hypothetical protein